jgi:hypothetical protein
VSRPFMPEIRVHTQRRKEWLSFAFPLLLVVALNVYSAAMRSWELDHASNVDVSQIYDHCGRAVVTIGLVGGLDRGRSYLISGTDPGERYSAPVFVSDPARAQQRASLLGMRVKVRGLVVCGDDGALQFVEEQFTVLDRP